MSHAGFRAALIAALSIAVTTPACSKESDRKGESGLPAAGEYQAPQPLPSAVGGEPLAGGQGTGSPHEGMAMGNPHGGQMGNPHGGQTGNPHEGMAMGNPHGGQMGNPHGGGTDLPNLPPPDPNRAIDKSKFLRGKIDVSKALKDRVESGAILFLSVRAVEPGTGEVMSSPLAVDRIDVSKFPVEFLLDESKAMSAGTGFSGPVVIRARIDRDGDAITRTPGDIEGELRASIPSSGLKMTLDSLIQ